MLSHYDVAQRRAMINCGVMILRNIVNGYTAA